MSFSKKRIEVTIHLANGEFDQSGTNTVTLKEHRVTANITNAGGDSMGALAMRVYGLTQEMMNRLTVVGPIAAAIRAQNKVSVSAGDDENGVRLIYSGVIDQAWSDCANAPDVFLNLVAFAGLDAAILPVDASSYKGGAEVATMMETLAGVMGLTFENNGVAVTLSNPYFYGTALTQVRDIARAAGIDFVIDRGTLAIWPRDGFRESDPISINPQNGLVGYPSFSSNGLVLTTEFNPAYKLGAQVIVESSLQVACGTWTTYTVNHSLESERQGGPWFSQIQCVPNVQ